MTPFRSLALAVCAAVLGSHAQRGEASEQPFVAYLTGYGYWDNTPPGSTDISHPRKHQRAGGTGTHSDPITIAVGHSIIGQKNTLDFPPGTIFYIKRLKKYAIVEDTCGDGPRPQNGPCHTGKGGHPWMDVYIGGKGSSPATSARCEGLITALQMVVMNPSPDYEVHPGDVLQSGCKIH